MRCWFLLFFAMVVFLSGCGGAVDTGPTPAGGYNKSKVKYEEPLAHVPKTDIEIGEFVVKEGADPIRLGKVITARNTEVFTFHGQIRGQPKIDRTHHVVVESTCQTEVGALTTSSGIGRCQLQGDLAVFEINVQGPSKPGRHRLTVKIIRLLRDDGTVLPENEPDSMVIAEGEIDVRDDDQKLTPMPGQLPTKQ